MNGIHVRGLACPFNQPNCYNETIEPGAFDKFLKEHPGELPMCFEHRWQIGTWTKLWTTEEGLWCEGDITHPVFAIIADAEGFKELSISFLDKDHPNCKTEARCAVDPWRSLLPKWIERVSAQHCQNVELREISLVKSGAFNGTHFSKV